MLTSSEKEGEQTVKTPLLFHDLVYLEFSQHRKIPLIRIVIYIFTKMLPRKQKSQRPIKAHEHIVN